MKRVFGCRPVLGAWRISVALLVVSVIASGDVASAKAPSAQAVRYHWTNAEEYAEKWTAPYGPGEGAVTVKPGRVTVDAATYTTGADISVFDHLKYIRISSESFAVPESGSLEFSVDITAATPGTEEGRVIHGCYGPPMSWDGVSPCDEPWEQTVFEGQQAGVVLNMVNFETGQLFDWFVSEHRVFALVERLPSNVTGAPGVGLDKAYTQIIKEAAVSPGKHNVAIRYTRGPGQSYVEYFLDHQLFARVDNVGVPLDVQGVPYTGYAPSLGPGEVLSLDSFVIGHGLFSLLDAFPYQHPDAPELSVSIPLSERLFGQGAIGTWKNFQVKTRPD